MIINRNYCRTMFAATMPQEDHIQTYSKTTSYSGTSRNVLTTAWMFQSKSRTLIFMRSNQFSLQIKWIITMLSPYCKSSSRMTESNVKSKTHCPGQPLTIWFPRYRQVRWSQLCVMNRKPTNPTLYNKSNKRISHRLSNKPMSQFNHHYQWIRR